jgi:hypothetical protein
MALALTLFLARRPLGKRYKCIIAIDQWSSSINFLKLLRLLLLLMMGNDLRHLAASAVCAMLPILLLPLLVPTSALGQC